MYSATYRLITATIFVLSVITESLAQAPASTNPVLVKGATLEVRKSDFELEKKNTPPDQRLELATNLPRIQRVLERLFLNKTLLSEARKTGFDKDPAVMAELEYTLNQKLASLYAAHLGSKITVPDLEPALREQYRLEASTLAEPEKVRASHILVNTKSRSKDEARRRAEEVRAKAVAGQDFKELVKQYSDDPSARRNDGDLGHFPFAQMVPEFAKAAFAMKTPGEISPLVETEFGFHVIRYVDRKPARTPTYEELRAKLLEEKEREYRAQQTREIFNRLMESQDPKANMDEVKLLLDNQTVKAMREWDEKLRKEIQGQQQPKRP